MKRVILDKEDVVNLDQLTPGDCLGISSGGDNNHFKYMLMYDYDTKTYDMFSDGNKCVPQYQNLKLEDIANVLEPEEVLYVFDNFKDLLRWKLN